MGFLPSTVWVCVESLWYFKERTREEIFFLEVFFGWKMIWNGLDSFQSKVLSIAETDGFQLGCSATTNRGTCLKNPRNQLGRTFFQSPEYMPLTFQHLSNIECPMVVVANFSCKLHMSQKRWLGRMPSCRSFVLPKGGRCQETSQVGPTYQL